MTFSDTTPAPAILVAIDVSKTRNDVLIEVPGAARRRRLEVPNTRVEHDHFIRLLQSLGAPVTAAFEATGNYHRPLAFRLLEAGISLRLASSVALARTREALHNGWDKNDPEDARVILHMLKVGATQTYADARRAPGCGAARRRRLPKGSCSGSTSNRDPRPDMPAARSPRAQCAREPRHHAERQASPLSAVDVLQDGVVHHLFA